MIKNYLKIAWRNLIKNKVSSFINIGGLAVGMAVVMLIGLWIFDELTYDHYHVNHDRIAQVIQNVTNNGEVQTLRRVPYPIAAELRKNYGRDFKYVVLTTGSASHLVAFGEKKLNQQGAFFEPEAPDMLSLRMLKGNAGALKYPSSMLLSESTAKAYFGDTDPVGKILDIDNQMHATVAGVYEDLPKNSSFSGLGFIAPWDLYFNNTTWIKTAAEPWRPSAFNIYVQLAENADISNVSLKIKDVKLHHVVTQLAKKKPALFLQAMNQWHLYDEFKDGKNIGGRIQYVWLFGIIGIFVLLLASINFMNLSTARSEKRAREVGIRKAIGSSRSYLIYQFFGESFLCIVLAFVISLLMVQLGLPFFNEVADKQITVPWGDPEFWVLGIAFSLVTGLFTGSYPAFYLSSFKPVKVLKGSFRVGRLATVPRKVLVVLQFVISIILIIGTIVVFSQIQFAKNQPVGYSRNGLVYITGASDIHKNFEALKADLFNARTVASIAEAGTPPTEDASSTSTVEWRGKDPNLSIDFLQNPVSYDFGKTIGWQFIDGRDFSRAFLTDSLGVVINETAAHFMGLEKPVGETIKNYGLTFKIIGVIKDVVSESPFEQITPTLYFLSGDANSIVLLKINPEISASAAISKIGRIFKTYSPTLPFEYQFVDQEYAKKFGNEERIGKLAGFFASLAIFISCLGLFGMASFIAEQRIKEIGIRKVLGATVLNLWGLLSADFVLLVIISLLIAMPAAYFFMHKWLQNYTYRADISWWIFASAGAGALIITLLTVSYQSIKAALANPVKSLKMD